MAIATTCIGSYPKPDYVPIQDWFEIDKGLTSTSGEVTKGACRHCNLGGKNYLEEEVVSFQPPTDITFRITDTNLPFDTADIRFTLVSEGDATAVTVSPLYQLKYGVLGKILDTLLVRPTYRKGMRDLLRGLKHHVETAAP